MKTFIIFTLAFVLGSHTSLAAVLIRAPGASPQEYSQFVGSHPELKTYSRVLVEKTQINQRQEEELFTLGESIQKKPDETLEKLKRAQADLPLSATSIQYAFDLSKKGLANTKSVSAKKDFKKLYCKTGTLMTPPVQDCEIMTVDFKAIQRQWPQTDIVMVESVPFNLSDAAFLEISSENQYHWTLLSDAQKPVHFYGTYQHFMRQQFQTEDLTQGTCSGYSASFDDFILNSEGLIFFSKGCAKMANAPQGPQNVSEWLEKNKTWVYPLGALLIGGAAYALKDKTLVVEKP
ncbi:MAG: hypothetical protein ACM3MG_09520 [Bacillota bacterium]